MNDIAMGAHYVFKGMSLIFHKRFRLFTLVPLIMSVFTFILITVISVHYYTQLILWFDDFLPSWLHWLDMIFWGIFILFFLIFYTFTFTLIATLLSAPFNGLLAEKVEHYQRGELNEQSNSLFAVVKDVPRIMNREIQKLTYSLPRILLLLLCFFIPFIQLIATPLWLVFNAWLMSIQYVDYPTDNHKIPFKDFRKALRGRPLLALSFGGVVMICTLIPVVNFFIVPAAVIGATLMWFDHYQ